MAPWCVEAACAASLGSVFSSRDMARVCVAEVRAVDEGGARVCRTNTMAIAVGVGQISLTSPQISHAQRRTRETQEERAR